MALEPGTIVDGKYEVIRVCGEGGMGTVYEAKHLNIHRRVAIKVLKVGVSDDDNIVQRFEREARIASSLGSEHITDVFDVGKLGSGQRFMILEYLEGESLGRRIKRSKRISVRALFPMIAQLLEGLAEAHDAGIVHRDLKPANVFLIKDKRADRPFVKILDFGISKFRSAEGEAMTQTGAIVGTPHYMAPEQMRGASSVDHRADLYAVGAIIYRALSGRTPHVGATLHELLASLVCDEPPDLASLADLPAEVVSIVHKALEREPSERYQDAEAFRQVLLDYLDSLPEADASMDDELSWDVPPEALRAAPTVQRSPNRRAPGSARSEPRAEPSSPRIQSDSPPTRALGTAESRAAAKTIPLKPDPTLDHPSLATPSPSSLDTSLDSVTATQSGSTRRWVGAAAVCVLLGGGLSLWVMDAPNSAETVTGEVGPAGSPVTDALSADRRGAGPQVSASVPPQPTAATSTTAPADASADPSASAKPTPPKARPVTNVKPHVRPAPKPIGAVRPKPAVPKPPTPKPPATGRLRGGI